VKVTQDLPIAGVITGLQIWGSILSIMMTIYAVIQWRGVMRRGGHVATLLPLMAGSVADAFYFATWSTVVHALAAEAGTLGLTLPLSPSEESVIEAMIYASLSLKVLKIAYVNYNICSRDIFFIDWSEYNPYLKDTPLFDRSNSNTSSILAREWAAIQTKRRTSPCVTVILTLFLLHLSEPWRSTVPDSQAYSWTLAVIAWWSSYLIVFLSHMALNRLFSSPSTVLPKLCADIEYSILIFQEDLFAHYVHGRNDDLSEAKYLSGPLITCRVICAAQFRAICKQLSTTTESSLTNIKSKQVLLSRFLAAFIERALDGLSWVASERTTLEKLFDVELMVREGGNTSILLYETENISPSCFAVTWWGNELTLSTFDSILFCSVAYGTREPIYAAITTVVLWQVMKYTTTWFSNRNLRNKLNVTF
ncbi:meckelin-like, partial [Battus philenor]|uniref:meckelin-like n=1 Tax=Battus philenor TaxID=42288 RepID=UPI0035D0264C